jgi:hypothetical protein
MLRATKEINERKARGLVTSAFDFTSAFDLVEVAMVVLAAGPVVAITVPFEDAVEVAISEPFEDAVEVPLPFTTTKAFMPSMQ